MQTAHSPSRGFSTLSKLDLRARFVSNEAPAVEPEPTLPPDAHASLLALPPAVKETEVPPARPFTPALSRHGVAGDEGAPPPRAPTTSAVRAAASRGDSRHREPVEAAAKGGSARSAPIGKPLGEQDDDADQATAKRALASGGEGNVRRAAEGGGGGGGRGGGSQTAALVAAVDGSLSASGSSEGHGGASDDGSGGGGGGEDDGQKLLHKEVQEAEEEEVARYQHHSSPERPSGGGGGGGGGEKGVSGQAAHEHDNHHPSLEGEEEEEEAQGAEKGKPPPQHTGRYKRSARMLDDDVAVQFAVEPAVPAAAVAATRGEGVERGGGGEAVGELVEGAAEAEGLVVGGEERKKEEEEAPAAAAAAAAAAGAADSQVEAVWVGHGSVFEAGTVDHSAEGAQVFDRAAEVAAAAAVSSSSALKPFSSDWLADPYGAEHARYRSVASGSLLGAMRRHHLVNDFVPHQDEWYTSQTCDELLAYFADVLPRSRNMIKTMEYSSAQLKEQVHELKSRNADLDAAHLARQAQAEAAGAAAGAAGGSGSGSGGGVAGVVSSLLAVGSSIKLKSTAAVATPKGAGQGLPPEIERLLFPHAPTAAAAAASSSSSSPETQNQHSGSRRRLLGPEEEKGAGERRAETENEKRQVHGSDLASLLPPSSSSSSSSSPPPLSSLVRASQQRRPHDDSAAIPFPPGGGEGGGANGGSAWSSSIEWPLLLMQEDGLSSSQLPAVNLGTQEDARGGGEGGGGGGLGESLDAGSSSPREEEQGWRHGSFPDRDEIAQWERRNKRRQGSPDAAAAIDSPQQQQRHLLLHSQQRPRRELLGVGVSRFLRGQGGKGRAGGQGGRNSRDGVKFNENKNMWSASIDVGQSRYSLGFFPSQELAQQVYDKELQAAKALGYGEQDNTPGSCESKLKKVYYQIHEVMLDTRQLDVVTGSLRTTIANLHDRNRVLEREFDLSPAALRWLSAPLFLDKSKLATTDTSAAAAQLTTLLKEGPHFKEGESVAGHATGSLYFDFEQAALLEGEDGADDPGSVADGVGAGVAAPESGGGSGGGGKRGKGSLVHNPTVVKIIDEYKRRRRLLQKQAPSTDVGNSSSAVVVGAGASQGGGGGVFAERQPVCTQEFVERHRKARTLDKVKHGCLTPSMLKKQRDLHGPVHQDRFPDYIHFVHIPKAGGTSFTKVLRRMMCTRNGATESELDCCAVGWCDWQKGITCQNIHGCTNHIPRMHKWLNRPLPSVTIMRNPVTRFVSAWHYRCHHPNYDCFNVRPDFKKVRGSAATKFTFKQYCEMPEYQNILIKMLVKDKFPYGNYGPLGAADLEEGKQVLDKFVFVGMNEMYDTSMVLLADIIEIPLMPSDFDKERTANRPTAYKEFMANLGVNTTLKTWINKANALDIWLYEHGRTKFCTQLRNSKALLHPMIETELSEKNVCLDLWGDPAATQAKTKELALVPGRS